MFIRGCVLPSTEDSHKACPDGRDAPAHSGVGTQHGTVSYHVKLCPIPRVCVMTMWVLDVWTLREVI